MISYVYVVNQIFESISDLFVKQISRRIGSLTMALLLLLLLLSLLLLLLFVFLPILLIKRLHIAVFRSIK